MDEDSTSPEDLVHIPGAASIAGHVRTSAAPPTPRLPSFKLPSGAELLQAPGAPASDLQLLHSPGDGADTSSLAVMPYERPESATASAPAGELPERTPCV